MHRIARRAGCTLALCLFAVTFAHAQAAKPAKPAPGTPQDPKQVYGKLLDGMSKEFADLADAMPEDKYNFVPTSGEFTKVRPFGDQVKHIIQANAYFFASPDSSQTDVKAKQDAAAKLSSKAEIMQALKDSFAAAHAYVDGITPDNAFQTLPSGGTRAGMTAFGLAHLMDHYGQLVVYLRMNGIVPPASRGGSM
jgi:uncharacterized damage-inducible protein DinB